MKHANLAVVIFALSFCGAVGAIAQPWNGVKAAPVSVCEAAANLEAYEGREVVRGRLSSDFVHASLIVDPACPNAGIMLGRSMPGVMGRQEWDEAWMATSRCREELMFTVRGRIERQHVVGMERIVLAAQAFSDLRRDQGSTCPMTLRELHERLDRSQQQE
jgi:hypothetical protein